MTREEMITAMGGTVRDSIALQQWFADNKIPPASAIAACTMIIAYAADLLPKERRRLFIADVDACLKVITDLPPL